MTYQFDDKVIARRCMEFVRWDGRTIRVYECQQGTVITPCEYVDKRYAGLMLVHFDGAGYWYVAPRDVQGVGR